MANESSAKSTRKGKDLIGQKFFRLTVVSFAGYLDETLSSGEVRRIRTWNCICDCGSGVVVRQGNLLTGNTNSCGCYSRDRKSEVHFKHGYTSTDGNHHPLYRKWCDMWTRCTNPKSSTFHCYGGRGICVSDPSWERFSGFLEDMGPTWNHGLTLDRIDPNGNYCKANCRWATKFEQAGNKRNNVKLTHNGETLTIAEWSRRTGIKSIVLYKRVWRGWADSDVLTKPLRTRKEKTQSLRE